MPPYQETSIVGAQERVRFRIPSGQRKLRPLDTTPYQDRAGTEMGASEWRALELDAAQFRAELEKPQIQRRIQNDGRVLERKKPPGGKWGRWKKVGNVDPQL